MATWSSALTADEFAAIRGAGFEPVGQVFGAAVYTAGSSSGYGCTGAAGSSGGQSPPGPEIQVSGRGGPGSYDSLAQAMDQARRTAVDRMTAECGQLGGHGVVGVRVSRGPFLLGGTQFIVIGTAVRAAGAGPGLPVPFTSDVSGQDFAKLITMGWVPAGLVLGLSIGTRHDDRDTARQARWNAGNTEMTGWTGLASQVRHDARQQLERDIERLGGEGAVITAMPLRVRRRQCPATAAVGRFDHVAEAAFLGTAVVRFSRRPQPHDGPALAIMSLDPQRRQAARIRI
ncbi:MAG TPA: heavy metal-binding domain-containing protein [Trebonia sp.]